MMQLQVVQTISQASNQSSEKIESKKKIDSNEQDFMGYLQANQQQQTEKPIEHHSVDGQNKSTDKSLSVKEDNPVSNDDDNNITNVSYNISESEDKVADKSETSRQDQTTQKPDSGQDGLDSKADCVDGCVKGFRPGASTEAAVNADLSKLQKTAKTEKITVADQKGKTEKESKTIGDSKIESELSKFTQMIEQIAKQINADSNTDNPKQSIKLGAKIIDRPNNLMPANSHLPMQKIVFETGLAEHFVRLITDEFDKLQAKQSSVKSDNSPIVNDGGINVKSASPSSSSLSASSANSQSASIVLDHDNIPETLNRALNIIRSNVGLRQSRLTVHLNPPDLGRMRIDIKLVDSNLRVNIVTETIQARHILADRLDTLRTALERQNINIVRFDIATRQHTNNLNQSFNQYYEQEHNGNNGESFSENYHHEQEREEQPDRSNTDTEEQIEDIANMVA